MAQADHQHAVLIVLHKDILPPREHEDGEPVDDAERGSEVLSTWIAAKREIPLTSEECTIGRNPDRTIRVHTNRRDISRIQATIKREGSRYRVYDDNSSNGTFVNSRKIVAPCLLDTGDILGFGDTPVMLRFVDPTRPTVVLTPREREIIHRVMAGLTNKQIATRLGITPDTVNTHLGHIFEKLQVHSRTEMVTLVQMKGLLDE